MEGMTIYVCGRMEDASAREVRRVLDGLCMRWSLLGLYDDRDTARARCRGPFDFVMPIALGRDMPETLVAVAAEWPLAEAAVRS